jgi:hypothetical protein
MFKLNCRTKQAGEGGLAILIIIVLLIGGGFWWLFATKSNAEKEGRQFANDAVQRLAVQHDLAFLESRLSPGAKMDLTPPQQKNLIETLTQLGTPAQPIKVDGNVVFESQFFDPHGSFTAQLNYPGRPGVLDIAISHPAGMWKLDSVRFALSQGR